MALSFDQSRHILGVLSTLEYLPYFKLIFYPDKVELGSDVGALRATTQFFSSLTRSESSRDLSLLSPLIEKVRASLTHENRLFNDLSIIKKDIDLIERAICGLCCLSRNQYKEELEKQTMIDQAIQTLETTKIFFSRKSGAFLLGNGGFYTHQKYEEQKRLLQEQAEEILRLRQELEKKKLGSSRGVWDEILIGKQ